MTASELAGLLPSAQSEAALASRVLRLPLQHKAWRGPAGAWHGAGLGNSLEFEDHRPYAPGDDLRHLDWQAYARTDQLVMKLHRHEASPQVDIALDISASQFAHPAKARRVFELSMFALESGLEARAAVRLWSVGTTVTPWPVEAATRGRLPEALPEPTRIAPAIDRVPWRPDALRLLVSDLLFPCSSPAILAQLGGARGAGLIFAPWTDDESSPAWGGRMELEDVESGLRREQRVDRELLSRYQTAYVRHFETWRDACRRHGIILARIAAGVALTRALTEGALRDGALEWAA